MADLGAPSTSPDESHLYVRNGQESHMAELARRAGHTLEEAERKEQELVSVVGCGLARAGELLLMADFDVNRAAEFHFTHGGGVTSAVMSPCSADGMQQVQVQATANGGQAMTVLIRGRGEYMVTVPDHVQLGQSFHFKIPALSLQTLETPEDPPPGQVITHVLSRGPTGFGVKLYHSKSRQIVEVDAVELGSPAARAGFQRHDSVISLAGVPVEGHVPEGLKAAMDRVMAQAASGVTEFEWVLRRALSSSTSAPAPPPLPIPIPAAEEPAAAETHAAGTGSAAADPHRVSVGAVPQEWAAEEDADGGVQLPRRVIDATGATPTLSPLGTGAAQATPSEFSLSGGDVGGEAVGGSSAGELKPGTLRLELGVPPPVVDGARASASAAFTSEDEDGVELPLEGISNGQPPPPAAGGQQQPEQSAQAAAASSAPSAVEQLVEAGARALNTARTRSDFQRAILKFESALQLSPSCEDAMYGAQQARKALEFVADSADDDDGSSSFTSHGPQHSTPAAAATLPSMTVPGSSGAPPSRRTTRDLADYHAPDGGESSLLIETPVPREAAAEAAGRRGRIGAKGTEMLMSFRVVSGAKVRQGRETSTHFVRELTAGDEIEVLEQALDKAGRVRLRCAEGWVSVQAADSTLLLEECFRPEACPQVCEGEKKVYSAEVSLRRPSGHKSQMGTAEITTKRLLWRPHAPLTPAGARRAGVHYAWQEEGISVPLQRVIAASGRGGGLGLGLTDGFELIFDSGPAWWQKEGVIDERATRWGLLFHRHSAQRDEFLSLLHGARADCKRMEGLTSPMTLLQQRVHRLCNVTKHTAAMRERKRAWTQLAGSSAAKASSVTSSAKESGQMLDAARQVVRDVRDAIFIEQGEPMRRALMSLPGWLGRVRNGGSTTKKEGWVRLMRVGNKETHEIWQRRFLLLDMDSLSWHTEHEAATRQKAPPTPLPLFTIQEIVRVGRDHSCFCLSRCHCGWKFCKGPLTSTHYHRAAGGHPERRRGRFTAARSHHG
jgi:hypothetical protein